MRSWQLQDASARLSEVVRDAEREGPQEITVHDRPVAVVLSHAEYVRLAGTGDSLVACVRNSPLAGAEDIEFACNNSLSREGTL
jgi:prevent-host-death family protein